jgi:multimeric flavodoxin WrbA
MGSPRIGGNTDLLLDAALKGAQCAGAKTAKILAVKLKIAPCKECYRCYRDGNCSLHDDMDALYPKLAAADRVILASPMFFYSLPAQTKALIDRCQALYARRYILKQEPAPGRKGAFIAVGATKGKTLFDGSRLVVKYFFDAIGVVYTDELLVRSVDKKGEIKTHPTALTDAFELGKRLFQSEWDRGRSDPLD